MDIVDAIRKRKSIRGFAPRPVEKSLIKKILETAVYAPSAMNTQPWEFFVIAGDVLNRIRKGIVDKLNSRASMNPDHLVALWPKESVYRDRQVSLAKQIFELMDIQREDKVKRAWWM